MSDAPQGQLDLNGVDPLAGKEFTVRKRDGRQESFNDQRILLAIESAFRADVGLDAASELSEGDRQKVKEIALAVVQKALVSAVHGEELEVERIQDWVETQLMDSGCHSVARRYIVYREERKKARALRGEKVTEASEPAISMLTSDGRSVAVDLQRLRRKVIRACRGLESVCSSQEICDEAVQNLYNGVHQKEVDQALVMAAKARIEREPGYSFVSARLLLDTIYREVLQQDFNHVELKVLHRDGFAKYINFGIQVERLSPRLKEFNIEKIAQALVLERDLAFTYLGLQTVYDRYLLHHEGRRIESPQYFWMRVAMGLALNEGDQKEERAIEFYNVLSQFYFVSSTPTLFNSGTRHPQLSSCYLSTVMDDLDHIFKVVSDDARLSKWAGGLGNDWTNVRATGSHIKGTNGTSQGVIPFLKVANDTAVAVNQGGKRKGAMCAYLETWHLDIEDFLELRKNTGDERRRTHDMNTANWIPDLFMKRVQQNAMWTLFDPSETPDLHDLFGSAFEKRYEEYESMVAEGKIKLFKQMEASTLYRKMLTMLFETGHPWFTFKDPSNVRSPQDHQGVVHSSNLCTEILLNTSKDETAVCNLGSINLVRHINKDRSGLDEVLLEQTITTAIRMLDNVIDINYYPTSEAQHSNLQHRPIGLGIMGFQDALYELGLSYASMEAVEFSDLSMEAVSYYAILASTQLAAERGTYSSYAGSKWSRGLLPIDTIDLLEQERGGYVDMDRSSTKNWDLVREAIRNHGMRNSNTMAIAPTATISNISGVSQSIEPAYKHLFVKSNLSGEFTVANVYLVNELKKRGLWDEEMIDDLKYYDGSIDAIDRIPEDVKRLFITAFELEARWLIECASRRQKWIDMGQSLNLYICKPDGKTLSNMYQFAWEKGLKTTYYLRSLAATQIEKSTMDINKRGLQPRWMKSKSASSEIEVHREASMTAAATPKACLLSDPECEACQ
ncbi:MAG: ribonucleoside-diphosphate reductase subunit alpha [Candidatus Methylacidiphilales bacterium]